MWNLRAEKSLKVETEQSSGLGTYESWTFSFPDS